MFFDYESGLDEHFKRKGSYLPGQFTKTGWLQIEALNTANTGEPIEFGLVVKRGFAESGVPIATNLEETDTSRDIYGVVLADEVSQSRVNFESSKGNIIHSYKSGMAVSVMCEGLVAVPVQDGLPIYGNPVYVRIAKDENKPYLPVGGVEATANVGTIQWRGAEFRSGSLYPLKGEHQSSTSQNATSQTAVIYITEAFEALLHPTITTAPTATAIDFGTTLGEVVLSGGEATYAGETVEGTFTMNNPNIVPNAGTETYTATFTPNDLDIYDKVTNIEVVVTVNKGTLTLAEAPTASNVATGSELSTSTISGGKVTFGGTEISGEWAWKEPETTVEETGEFVAQFTADQSENFEVLEENLTVTVE